MEYKNHIKENNGINFWQPMTHPADARKNNPIIITDAEGVHITDIDGHKTLDAVGGLWNVNLGYSCQPIKDAISQQLQKLPYYSAFRGTTNDQAIELSCKLAEFFREDGLSRSFFTSGGSDSVEVSLRLARQYHKIKGESGRVKFLSLKYGYHGTHIGGASVNGNNRFRTQYEPLLPGCFHIPAPYTYRNPFNESDPEKLAARCAEFLEEEINFQGKETIAAMIIEPILGAGGVIPPHKSFMPMVREICDRNGILMIADEVITAFGRSGSPSGSRLWGVKPDFMTVAKAITSGYFPFGAVMIGDKVAEVFEKEKEGLAAISSGYTYSGHPVGAAAANACLDETCRLSVHENAAQRGDELYRGLLELQKKYDIIGDVRGGHGLMCALELVKDRESKKSPDKAIINNIFENTYKAGAMVRVSGQNLILSPPLIIDRSDVETILQALDKGLKSA